MTKLDETLVMILGELKEIKKDFKNFKISQEEQAAKFNTIFKQLKDENSILKRIVTDLQQENQYLNSEVSRISFGLNSTTQDKLSNNLIITGVPFAKSENLSDLVIATGSILKIKITTTDFKVKRIFSKANKSVSNLLVEFVDIGVKKKLINNRKEFGLSSTQLGFATSNEIYFFNQLTAYNLELLAEARNLKNKFKFKFIWFQNNQVLLRKSEKAKIYSIRSKQDLVNIQNLFKKDESTEIIGSSSII